MYLVSISQNQFIKYLHIEMKLYYLILYSFCLGAMLIACSQEIAEENVRERDKIITSKLDSIAQVFLADRKVMGFSIAVHQGQKMLYNKGFGKTDTIQKKEAHVGTIYNLASISKLIGATVAMKLVEEGKLSLDQTLEELLPDFPDKEKARKIKFRHLISMTSGLKEYAPVFDSIYVQTGITPSRKDFFEFFSQEALDFEPGTFYKYSNSGFALLPLIFENISGESYDSLINRIINIPTGFNIRHISLSQTDPNISQFFELQNGKINHRPYWSWIKGDGGLTASSWDLVRYPGALRDGQIISKNSFQQMIAPTPISGGFYSDYGFGVKNGAFEGSELWGHSGADKTYWSMMFYFPAEKMTLVTLVNTNNTPNNAQALFNQVALTVLGKQLPDHSGDEILAYDRTPFVGEYIRPGDSKNKMVSIVENPTDQHLYYVYGNPESEGEKMYYLGNGEFWIARWPTDRVTFDKGPDGNVIVLKEYYAGYFTEMRRKVR